MQRTSERAEAAPSSAGTRAAEAVPLMHLPGRIARLAGELGEARTAGMRLRLDPPALGEIRVQIEATGHGVDVRIVTQSGEAAALLSHRQHELRDELARSGLTLQAFSTTVSSDAGQHAGDGADASRHSRQPAGAAHTIGASFASQMPGSMRDNVAQARSSGAGRLDARA